MMSEQHFDAQLRHIEEQTAARQERVDGYRDQELARLFLESGWSQEQLAVHLAKTWGKEVSPDWVAKRLRFGRFLSFFNTSGIEEEAPGASFKLPANLTERAFRTFWEATEAGGNYSGHKASTEAALADERRRFGEVVEALKGAGLRRRGKPVKKAIIAVAGRGQWLTAEQLREQVAEKLNDLVTTADVTDCLQKHIHPTPESPYRLEKTGEGETKKYRVVKVRGQVVGKKQIAEWTHQLVPLLNDLIREAQKDRVEVSLSALCALASKIKKVVENVTAAVPDKEKAATEEV